MSRSRIRLAAVVVAGLALTACGDADDTADEASTTSTSPDAGEAQADAADSGGDTMGDTTGGDMDDAMDDDGDVDDMGDMGDMSGAYGEPADASDADRTIEVAVDNAFAFEPDEYEVAAGEVVTFQITNTGDIEHEFVLGDEQVQQQMAEEMAEGDDHAHSGEMSNAVTIHGGEQAELTWRFPAEATTVLIGCHLPGHWEAGMRASVTVG